MATVQLMRLGYTPKSYVRGCAVLDCPDNHVASGFCGKHYHLARHRRLQEPHVILHAVLCGFTDCDNEARSGFVCKEHAKQHQTHGKMWAIGTCLECGQPWNQRYKQDTCSDCLKSPGRRHGLNRFAYDRLLDMARDRGCFICGTSTPGGRYNSWQIDHDHKCCQGQTSCGKCIRGLLCWRCNAAIGLFDDNANVIQLAQVYLATKPIGEG
jgi:hypothetical protein